MKADETAAGGPSKASGREGFVRAHTRPTPLDLCPEIRLWLSDDALALWNATEAERARDGGGLPFWGFAWAGGQALSRYILDHPETVAGKVVLDAASGSGLVAIAAARAGAARVTAVDIDPYAEPTVALNAAENGVDIAFDAEDPLDTIPDAAVVLAGDVFYEARMARRFTAWFDELTRSGIDVLVGDPGRDYSPASPPPELARYRVPTPRTLEDSDEKTTTVRRWVAGR